MLNKKKIRTDKQRLLGYTRLRLGYCNLNKHLKTIGLINNENCTECNTSETVEHYLLHCIKYENQRLKLKHSICVDNQQLTLPNIFSNKTNNIKAVIEFIVSTGKLTIL